MRVVLFQMSVDPENVPGNIERIESRIAVSKGDLLVFPEACTSGFPYRRLAEVARLNTSFLDRVLQNQRKKTQPQTIVLPLLVAEGDRFFNRQYVLSGGEIQATYDKIHLIGLLGEDRFLAPGQGTTTTEIQEFSIGLATCYDLRFPELFRKLTMAGGNLLVVPAMWPVERATHLQVLARARAIENLSYLILCNATGKAGNLTLCGQSIVVDPKGEVLAEAGAEEIELAVDLSLEAVHAWRKSFPALNDVRLL